MRVGQPSVKRKERDFDAERECEGEKEQRFSLASRLKFYSLFQYIQGGDVIERAARNKIERDDACQHQEASDRRVDEKFCRGVNTLLAAPDSDQEKHRDERRLEEEIEDQ